MNDSTRRGRPAPCRRSAVRPSAFGSRRFIVVMALWLVACVARGQEAIPFPDPPAPADAVLPADVALPALPPVPYPGWTRYGLAEALFWGRDNQALDRTLIETVDTGEPLLTSQDMQFPFSEGVRAFYGARVPEEGGWEIGYFGVYGQAADAFTRAVPPDFLQVPPPLGDVFTTEGETATISYTSIVNSAEANLFRTWTEWRPAAGGWLTVDWLAGFRYVGVEERAGIVVDCCVVDDQTIAVPYEVRTRNNMFGAQLGGRGRYTWTNWAVEGWAKAGLLGNAEEQMQAALVDYTGFRQRPAISTSGSEVGFIGDLNLSVIYRLTEVWGIRAGYSTVWISGLALAPDQFDFTLDDDSGTRLRGSRGMFLHGANLGLEARW
jgi:hypothetical protein